MISMNKSDKLDCLIDFLLTEMPIYKDEANKFGNSVEDKKNLFQSLMNVRPAMPMNADFLKLQDEYLSEELSNKDIVSPENLTPILNDNIYLWQGDITTLAVSAIVNAANSALLGCFIPCHRCIDNAIHSASGIQLRDECNQIMKAQNHDEPTGTAKITSAYNLPCKFVIHTVGPIVSGELTAEHRELLKLSYKSCLELAISKELSSIAFCCISTGEFHFPQDIAAEIAVNTVSEILSTTSSKIKVVFNVFKDEDRVIYERIFARNKRA